MSESTTQSHILRAIVSQPWAITEQWLDTILAIAQRTNPSIEAVEAQLGRPLDNTHTVTTRDGVATIPIQGPIVRYAGLFSQISGATSVETLATDFRAALADPQVHSIILSVDSPGGEVSGTSEFASMVHMARGIKPITAYISDLGCSAAYWIASAADSVVVADTACVGSIGVVAAVPDTAEDKDTVTFVSSQSPNKRVQPRTESGQSQIQAMVDDVAAVFVDAVARHRNVSPETVTSDFGSGGVFIGQKAVDAGLADRVGSYEGIVAGLTPQPFRLAAQTSKTKTLAVHRSSRMNALDWLKGKAQEDGVDTTELDAAFGGHEKANAALQAQLKERDAAIAQMREQQERHAEQLAQAAQDRRQAEAAAYADRLVASHRLTPASAQAFAPIVATLSASGQDIAPLLQAFTETLPDMSVFTTEQVKREEAAPLYNQATTEGVDKPKIDPKVREALLASTPEGRNVLASLKNGN